MKTSLARFQGTDQLEQAIAQVVGATSDAGYLSIYETIEAADPEKWRTDLKVRLAQIASDAGDDDGAKVGAAIERAMDALEAWPDSDARSFAGFLDLADPQGDLWFNLEYPVVPLVAVGHDPSIGTLLALSERAAPTGVVCWSNDIVVIDEWRGHVLERIANHRAPDVDDEDISLGQGTTGPGNTNQSLLQRDRHDRVVKEHQHAWLLDWARVELRKLIRERGWQRIVQFGPAPIEPSEIAQPGNMLQCFEGGKDVLIHEPMGGLKARVEDVLGAEEHGRSTAVVRDVVGGRPGTVVGLEATRKALEEGRVALLLLAHNGGDELPAQEPLIRQALNTSSEMQFIHGPDAEPLLNAGGVAAVLRY
jgi:hypothetical protein